MCIRDSTHTHTCIINKYKHTQQYKKLITESQDRKANMCSVTLQVLFIQSVMFKEVSVSRMDQTLILIKF